MPEGDTLLRIAKNMGRALVGQPVTEFSTAYAHVARVDEDHPLKGQTVEAVSTVGKHLLIRFSSGLTLRTHLRMNGSWHLYRPGEKWHRPASTARLVLHTPTFVAVGFDVPVAELLTDAQLERSVIAKLGPDLLGATFDEAEAIRRLRAHPERSLGESLLDQRAAAGLGNQYKSEVLFLGQVNPFAPLSSVDDDKLRELLALSRKLMATNVRVGHETGPVTYLGLRRTTHRANPAEHLWVYSRSGQPCRKCGTPISFAQQGLEARVTYFCPTCQPMP